MIIIPLQFFTVAPPDGKKYGWMAERIFILCYIEELIDMLVGDVAFYNWKSATDNEIYIVSDIIMLFVLAVACLVRKASADKFANQKRLHYIRNGMFAAVIFVAIEIVGCVAYLDYMTEKLGNDRYYMRGKIFSALTMVGIGILILFVVYIRNSNEKMEMMIEMEKALQQQQVQYYEDLLRKEEATRNYRHDMIGHLICLQEYTNAGDLVKIREYIDGMQENLDRLQKRNIYSGNRILDTVLNYYISQLGEEVAVTITGTCNKDLDISDMDLCTIFSNLIQNAVEHLNHSAEEGRFLTVNMKPGTKYFEVEIKNFVEKEKLSFQSNGELDTTKTDKKNHGIGISNVQRAVAKNRGRFDYHVEDGVFRSVVMLNIKSSL